MKGGRGNGKMRGGRGGNGKMKEGGGNGARLTSLATHLLVERETTSSTPG